VIGHWNIHLLSPSKIMALLKHFAQVFTPLAKQRLLHTGAAVQGG
jgi:hypothetical protein